MKQSRILLLDFDPESGLAEMLARILGCSPCSGLQLRRESFGHNVLASCKIDCSAISQSHPDVVLVATSLNFHNEISVLVRSFEQHCLGIPIVVVTEGGCADELFNLLKLGVADFIIPPLREIDILPRIWRLVAEHSRKNSVAYSLTQKLGLKQLVGQSPALLAEVKKIPQVAKCDASVLILGETGTGKELFARAIHYLSPRRAEPFIPVNCAAIPLELVENELFGHEKGAFTGASSEQSGLIREADGGTLFLDEIDCLPLLAQAKLLRFLQAREYRSLGSSKMRRADVRVLAAANNKLAEAVRTGKLREDLYYRLNVIPFTLPPLRDRREDIPLLARHFLAKYAGEFNSEVTDFSSDALQVLLVYDWPGNVRELENVVERAVVFSGEAIIQGSDILLPHSMSSSRDQSFKEVKKRVIVQFEKTYIQGLLLTYQGNISKAAQAARKNRRAFWQLIRKHHIDVQSFRSLVS